MNLDKKSIAAYMQRKKLLPDPGTPLRTTELSDGLKNVVYLVSSPSERWIVKQALSRAQVKERWWLDRRRIFAEKNCIEILHQILPPQDVL